MLVIPLGGFYPPVKIEQGLWDVLVGDRYPSTNGGAGTAGVGSQLLEVSWKNHTKGAIDEDCESLCRKNIL